MIKDNEELLYLIKNKSENKKIALFGVGVGLVDIIEFLKKNNIKISYVIDNSVEKCGKKVGEVNSKITDYINDIMILNPKQLLSIESNNSLFVIITPFQHFDVIEKQLDSLGFNDYYFPFKYFYKRCEYSDAENDKISLVHDILEDGESKKAYNYYIKGLITSDVEMFKKAMVYSKNLPYVTPDFFTFSSTEVFVDCGAYTGDTITDFINHVKGKYKLIYGIEPNSQTFRLLSENLSCYDNIQLFNKGISEVCQTLGINTYGNKDAGSNLVEINNDYNGEIIHTVSIDEICKEQDVSYIKMDIEGFEEKALIGARKTIEKYKPKLAISVYHKKEDIYTIPLLIKELNKNYKLFFRSYYPNPCDGIIYAM